MSCFGCAKSNIENAKCGKSTWPSQRHGEGTPLQSVRQCYSRESDISTGLMYLTCHMCSEAYMRNMKCLMCLTGTIDNSSFGSSGDPLCRKCQLRTKSALPDKYICNVCGLRTKTDPRYLTCETCFGLCLTHRMCPVCRHQYTPQSQSQTTQNPTNMEKYGVRIPAATRQGFMIICSNCASVSSKLCMYCFHNELAPNSNSMCQRCVEHYNAAKST